MSQRITKAKRRYVFLTLGVMLGYLAVVFIASQLEDYVSGNLALTALALAPVVVMGVACVMYLRMHGQMDEREQHVNEAAGGAALIVGVMASTAGGFLQSFGVVAIEDPLLWFSAFLIVAWSMARIFIGGFD